MTDVTWQVRDRYVHGVTGVSSAGGAVTIQWSGSAASVPGEPYPSLHLLSVAVPEFVSGAVAANRRVRIQLAHTLTPAETDMSSFTLQGASQTRSYEFALGFSFATPLASTFSREALPDGLILHPTDLTTGTLMTVSILNYQAGTDGTFVVHLRGMLLYP